MTALMINIQVGLLIRVLSNDKYHHVSIGPGNNDSREYVVGGQVEDSSEGVYNGAGYPGTFSSHPNFYQPHTPRGGS